MSSVSEKISNYTQLKLKDDQFIWRFSPNRTDPQVLEAIFVGREPMLQNVLEKVVESATTESKHHILLYGPRGIGKSHFISLLHHRLNTDKKLGEKIRIARLNEVETTTSVAQLLVRIYRSLCDEYPDEFSSGWLDELLSQSPEEIASVLIRRLVTRFELKTLVVMVENLNLLFENLGTAGQQELRALLQEHSFACLIATSQQLFKSITDRDEPFFGFFQAIPLKPMSLQDAHELLVKIANAKGLNDLAAFLNTPDGHSRVRAIHDLAGGNHRVYIVLSGFMTRESLDQLVVPFQKMADDLTPYYQERLRWISPQQRQIVELLCREPGTVNPKAMARRLLASEQTIGKQVRKLVEIGYLTATQRGRETFYELSEPLMRLAYEVKEQSLLLMLVDFLRIWYRPDPLQQLQAGDLTPSTQEYADALEIDPKDSYSLFNRAEALFAMSRWQEGFESIRQALSTTTGQTEFLGNTASMFSLVFRLSSDEAALQSHINTLVDLYKQATERRKAKSSEKPLSWLGAGLVKALAKIDSKRVTPLVLESYLQAVEHCLADIPECQIPLRLFRYGIRYLISIDPTVFVELIQPERQIVQQALGLS